MPGIFISYRREDSSGHAGRLFDKLSTTFGRDNVFMDVSAIDPGLDFVDAIEHAVGSCDVLLAVIGREWIDSEDTAGRRRLENSKDFIRIEIATALQRNVRVIPVLVRGAVMPHAEALPPDLERLTRRQAVEVRDARWDADVDDLIDGLRRVLSTTTNAPAAPGEGIHRFTQQVEGRTSACRQTRMASQGADRGSPDRSEHRGRTVVRAEHL